MYAIVYEGVRGFAIATTRVTDGTLRYWPDKKPLYKPGPHERCSFMAAPATLWSHDKLADEMVPQLDLSSLMLS
ncbi:MAG: hypothetical protein H5T36_05080 [Methanobacteriaceae archaeon]|nr:hypothetical protein [Methanobacteriaceae archaeon]